MSGEVDSPTLLGQTLLCTGIIFVLHSRGYGFETQRRQALVPELLIHACQAVVMGGTILYAMASGVVLPELQLGSNL